MKRLIYTAAGIMLLLYAAGAEESRVTVIRGGRILTGTGDVVENGILILSDGRIAAVGRELKIPPGSRLIEAEGTVITPGLIDSHSHLGLGPSGGITEDNEMSDPVTPQLRIIDSIHPEGVPPHRDSFRDALAEGVTTIIARPGSGNVIGGQSAALKLTGGTVDDMLLKFPCDMKMAMGRKGYGAKGVMPVTKMAVAYLVRKAMLDAESYRKDWEKYEAKRSGDSDAAPPRRNLKHEAMLPVLNKELPVHIHASGVDDIMTAVRLGDEFDFEQLSIGHGDEAWKIADQLAKRKIAVVVGPQMIVYDEHNRLINLAEFLRGRGVEVSIMTDADVVQQEYLRMQAGLAVKYGMDPGEALKAITLHPARRIGMAHRIGSIEVGKDADIVIFSGDPFDIQTRVLRVLINGRCVLSAETETES